MASDPSTQLARSCTAFVHTRRLMSGALIDVALAIKDALAGDPDLPVLTFDDATGAVIDLDLRGTTAEIVARLAAPPAKVAAAPHRAGPAQGRGRPKLGVVAREVTLLPRHWEWLAAQPGGASQALRRLVDEARRADGGRTKLRLALEAAYRFTAAMAGDRPGFEEASRALFANDRARFAGQAASWPADVREHAIRLAWGETTPERR